MHNLSTIINFGIALFLLQNGGTDYGGWIAPLFAFLATGVTIWSQVKQKKLENEITSAHLKSDSNKEVMEQWKEMFKNQREEIRENRLEIIETKRRLRTAEGHTKICERGQLRLVAQLIKAGVDVDFDKILEEMALAEKMFLRSEHGSGDELHDTKPPARSPATILDEPIPGGEK